MTINMAASGVNHASPSRARRPGPPPPLRPYIALVCCHGTDTSTASVPPIYIARISGGPHAAARAARYVCGSRISPPMNEADSGPVIANAIEAPEDEIVEPQAWPDRDRIDGRRRRRTGANGNCTPVRPTAATQRRRARAPALLSHLLTPSPIDIECGRKSQPEDREADEISG